MKFPTDYPDDDKDIRDPIDSRHFFELSQAYRHAKDYDSNGTVKAFLALQAWLWIVYGRAPL